MKDIDDGEGKMEERIKIIRAESIGLFSWDTSSNNSGLGINDWTQADLMTELKTDYLNYSLAENKQWYNGRNNQKTGTFNKNNVLSSKAQSYIKDAKWHLGGITSLRNSPIDVYYLERGTSVLSGRPTTWTGKIALPYPSDFAFASHDLVCRSDILNIIVNSVCHDNDWFTYLANGSVLFLTPDSSSSSRVYNYNYYGSATNEYAYSSRTILPAAYLKSDVLYVSGVGSKNNPFIIE